MTTTDMTTPLVMCEPDEIPLGDRDLSYRWIIHQENVEERGTHGVHYTFVTLSVRHYGRSEIHGRPEYCFIARLEYEDITRYDNGINSQKFAVFGGGGVRLGQAECKRFSSKRLTDFAWSSLVDLRGRRDEDMVVSMFAGEGWDPNA